MKKLIYFWCLCFGAAACQTPATQDADSDNALPNVILILVDDMGYADLGAYGSEVATPNLDRLAQEGMRFTQVYNTSKCFPSRACLLTGLYAQQIGYHTGFKQPMERAITLGELFKSAGYRTLWSGKHHSTEQPMTRGFDHYSGLLDGAANHFNPGQQRPGEGKPAQKRPDRSWVIDGKLYHPYTPPDKDFYTTDAFTDYALNWLRDEAQQENPFFLYLSYTAPHDPLMAWPEDIAKYRGKYRAGYAAIRQARFEKQKQNGLLPANYPLSAPSFQAWDQLTEAEKDEADLKMAVYAAMIDRLDQNIGRLLDHLRATGADENTLLLFTSDNGASAEVVRLPVDTGQIGTLTRWTSLGPDWANVANTPLRYFKNYSHEGGIRTPLIAWWPKGITATGRVEATPLHFIDFMATFVELTGATYPEKHRGQSVIPLDGISFLPLLKGKSIQRKEPLYWQWAKGKAIREGDWKLVAYQDEWALYNLKDDPVETNDLSEVEPELVVDLQAKYAAWAQEMKLDN